ncbi:MAG: hypothetical protein RBU37_12025 [Myxococcota bacterium]|nr:hypothetical protein [Myxococcota bacterium]
MARGLGLVGACLCLLLGCDDSPPSVDTLQQDPADESETTALDTTPERPVRYDLLHVRPLRSPRIDAIGVRKPSGEYRWSWTVILEPLLSGPTRDTPSATLLPPNTYLNWPAEPSTCQQDGDAYSAYGSASRDMSFIVSIWGAFEEGDHIVIVPECPAPSSYDVEPLAVSAWAEAEGLYGPRVLLERSSDPTVLEYVVPALPAWSPSAEEELP